MRTTLTLDNDVAAKLKAEVRRTGNSFKQLVNDALRRELNKPPEKKLPPFKVKARDWGLRPGYSYDNVWELIEQIEGPDYK
ncbi:MAG: CopG family transcriptional regulator [Terriglobales bacterium]